MAGHFGGKQDAGNPRPRVSSRSDNVETSKRPGAIVRAKIGRLRQRWLDGESRTQVAAQIRGKVEGSELVLYHNTLRQSCQPNLPLQSTQDSLTKGRSLARPVHPVPQVRNRSQHVQTLSSRRR